MKYLIILFIFTSGFILSQEQDNIIFHSEKRYSYPKYEDKDLLKLKTESYIIKLKNDGFVITKNEVKEYKFDINVSDIFDNKNAITFNLVYTFFDSFYTVDLWNPKIYIAKKKKWVNINKYNADHDKIRNIIENISFKEYENDVNANF